MTQAANALLQMLHSDDMVAVSGAPRQILRLRTGGGPAKSASSPAAPQAGAGKGKGKGKEALAQPKKRKRPPPAKKEEPKQEEEEKVVVSRAGRQIKKRKFLD